MIQDKHESIDGLDRMIQEEMRKQAISWWNSMGFAEQKNEWEKWKLITTDRRKNWLLLMVDRSSSTIERIYRELVLEENFD